MPALLATSTLGQIEGKDNSLTGYVIRGASDNAMLILLAIMLGLAVYAYATRPSDEKIYRLKLAKLKQQVEDAGQKKLEG